MISYFTGSFYYLFVIPFFSNDIFFFLSHSSVILHFASSHLLFAPFFHFLLSVLFPLPLIISSLPSSTSYLFSSSLFHSSSSLLFPPSSIFSPTSSLTILLCHLVFLIPSLPVLHSPLISFLSRLSIYSRISHFHLLLTNLTLELYQISLIFLIRV